ncbi:hypothetical protein BJ170DRAFT_331459 [Xylariales sp. AK1849]|nr:hypothetical protein BJ170DRAFT_331459 [Xylariales sp. AK1849]
MKFQIITVLATISASIITASPITASPSTISTESPSTSTVSIDTDPEVTLTGKKKPHGEKFHLHMQTNNHKYKIKAYARPCSDVGESRMCVTNKNKKPNKENFFSIKEEKTAVDGHFMGELMARQYNKKSGEDVKKRVYLGNSTAHNIYPLMLVPVDDNNTIPDEDEVMGFDQDGELFLGSRRNLGADTNTDPPPGDTLKPYRHGWYLCGCIWKNTETCYVAWVSGANEGCFRAPITFKNA